MKAVTGGYVIEIPRNAVPDGSLISALAQECYPDMATIVEMEADIWRVRLSPRSHATAAFDPSLAAVLSSMDIRFDDVMGWHRASQHGRMLWLEAMNHSWALMAWAQWLLQGEQSRPVLIHVDAHDDLGVPPLLCCPNDRVFTEVMVDEIIDLDQPPTVRRAIEHGAIGIGSFITPFLRALPADIVHLASSEPAINEPVRRCFTVEAVPWPQGGRLGRLALNESKAGSTYVRITDPADFSRLGLVGSRPVLVDIDLDYFDLLQCRRGEQVPMPRTPDVLIDALAPLADQIAVVTVAYSPGFCPATSWSVLLSQLRAGFGILAGER